MALINGSFFPGLNGLDGKEAYVVVQDPSFPVGFAWQFQRLVWAPVRLNGLDAEAELVSVATYSSE